MKRSQFIGLTLGALAAGAAALAGGKNAIAGLIPGFRRFTAPSIERKARILAACFPHLRFETRAARRFVTDYMSSTGQDANFPLKRDTLKRFLLSTDFVQREGKGTITYVAFYSPWSSVCYNPYMLRQNEQA